MPPPNSGEREGEGGNCRDQNFENALHEMLLGATRRDDKMRRKPSTIEGRWCFRKDFKNENFVIHDGKRSPGRNDAV